MARQNFVSFLNSSKFTDRFHQSFVLGDPNNSWNVSEQALLYRCQRMHRYDGVVRFFLDRRRENAAMASPPHYLVCQSFNEENFNEVKFSRKLDEAFDIQNSLHDRRPRMEIYAMGRSSE